MQDRPTAPELLEALAEYLYAELRPHVPPEQRFKTLVAANLCAVVARELRGGERGSVEDLALFERLSGVTGAQPESGGADERARDAARELCSRLRSGELDSDLTETIAGLRLHVGRKLEVARPGYADPT